MLASLGVLLWTGPATAERACINDDERKVCLDITSVPSTTVQPSGLAGTGTDTYVHYTSTLRIAGNKSSRFVTLQMTLDRSHFVGVEAPADVQCSLAGATISCFLDKLDPNRPVTVTSTARAPETEGPFTNTATFGWNGRVASAARTVQVVQSSGETWGPGPVTVVTGDPDQEVTPENPLWARFSIPGQSQPFHAAVSVTTAAGTLACTGGLWLPDGGPYVCRETGNRWVQLELSTVPDGTLLQFEMKWDASTIPAIQLPPSPVAPTGTPRFAVFYAHNPTPPPAVASAHAFANMCAAPIVAPCLTGVSRDETTGDWTATGYMEVDSTIIAEVAPLAPLYALLNYLFEPATAVGIKPPLTMQ